MEYLRFKKQEDFEKWFADSKSSMASSKAVPGKLLTVVHVGRQIFFISAHSDNLKESLRTCKKDLYRVRKVLAENQRKYSWLKLWQDNLEERIVKMDRESSQGDIAPETPPDAEPSEEEANEGE